MQAKRAKATVERAILSPGRARSLARSHLKLPTDTQLGEIGRQVLLQLALDEAEDSRVRVVAARELVVLGVAEEERRRLAGSAQLGELMSMSDAELERHAAGEIEQ
jgi:hypothetical protein